MQFQLNFFLAALATTAAASPLPSAAAGIIKSNDLVARANNCTQYCSVSAGCVCTVRPSDCTELYTVKSGDTCTSIAQTFGNFTVSQLYKWNPDVGQTCFSLQAYVPICVATPWYTFTPPVQEAYNTVVGSEAVPVPVMPGIVSSCQSFELVGPGTRVDDLAAQNGFEEDEFATWNGNATSAWQDYWACVRA